MPLPTAPMPRWSCAFSWRPSFVCFWLGTERTICSKCLFGDTLEASNGDLRPSTCYLFTSSDSRSVGARSWDWAAPSYFEENTMHLSNESLLAIVLVGLIAGWLAGQIMQGSGFGLIGDLVVGLLGAFIGDWL